MKKYDKKGVSLIILVITILIIIILAGAVILTFFNNNSILAARKSQFLSDVVIFKNDLILYQINKLSTSNGSYKFETLNANKTKIDENGVEDTTKNITDIIASIKNTKYLDLFEIKDGILVYGGINNDEIAWCNELFIPVLGVHLNVVVTSNETLKSLTITINAVNSNNSPVADTSKIDSYNLYISDVNSFDTVAPIVLAGNTNSVSYTKTDIVLGKEYFVKADMTMDSRIFSSTVEKGVVNVVNDGIVALVRDKDILDGTYQMTSNGVNYQVEVYNFYDDVEYTSSPVLGNNTSDQSMLILKYHKNLTIASGIILTPQVRKKGMYVCVNGTLTNNGVITMTARGAIAVGETVYLWKNSNETYESIPAAGGTGGVAVTGQVNGISGIIAPTRGTGGGGSGSSMRAASRGGNGSAGTSYSGGSGGGGASSALDSPVVGKTATINGGAGGAAVGRRTSATMYVSSGGAGNPGGRDAVPISGANVTVTGNAVSSAETGTGGLLIIYGYNIYNNGTIESKGSASKFPAGYNTSVAASGGSSGGGSINIFYKTLENIGTITAQGGQSGACAVKGGNGGDGSITTTQVY
jgi:hypothetical protein